MPSPSDTLERMNVSPVPTQTMFGLDGAMAMAPIDWADCSSKMGRQRLPPSVDFHTPPDAPPA